MRTITELSEGELADLLQQFYTYFSDGYRFEEFLKSYLEKIGLDEVVVTQRSRDGGIDLTAMRKGIGEFGDSGSERYYIQAKRLAPQTSLAISVIKNLRGSINQLGKGIIITTGKVSPRLKEEGENFDIHRPIIIIDGIGLVLSCIDNGIGFVYKPVFSSDAMDDLMPGNQRDSAEYEDRNFNIETTPNFVSSVEKQITANDIRARILSIPRSIFEQIDTSRNKIIVTFNNEITRELTLNVTRKYLAGVTELYKQFGLIKSDGTLIPSRSTWLYDQVSQTLNVRIEKAK